MTIYPRPPRRPQPSLKTWRASAPTIHEVARRAHVSSATVSRVLSGSKFVSGELAERVWEAVRELDYRPNHVARNLRARATSTIGVVIPDIQNPFFTSLVRGIEDALQAQKFTLLLANSDGDSARERVCLDTLCAEEVAGLLVVPCNAEPGAYDHLVKQGVPVVAVDRSPAGLNVDVVGVTNEEGARAAVLHLAGLGWDRIALVGGPLSTNVAVEREQGYRRGLDDAGLPFSASLVERADFREEGGYRAMANLLRVTPRPTAVFVANNLMAMGALHAISDASLRVPEDIALVLFDDIPWGARVNPPLTAVVQPTYDLGVSAARILLDRILEPHRPVRRVALQTTLIVRASCGAGLSGRTRPNSERTTDPRG
jgi:LacI family transcriptional regulator, galactose operon repressor